MLNWHETIHEYSRTWNWRYSRNSIDFKWSINFTLWEWLGSKMPCGHIYAQRQFECSLESENTRCKKWRMSIKQEKSDLKFSIYFNIKKIRIPFYKSDSSENEVNFVYIRIKLKSFICIIWSMTSTRKIRIFFLDSVSLVYWITKSVSIRPLISINSQKRFKIDLLQ